MVVSKAVAAQAVTTQAVTIQPVTTRAVAAQAVAAQAVTTQALQPGAEATIPIQRVQVEILRQRSVRETQVEADWLGSQLVPFHRL